MTAKLWSVGECADRAIEQIERSAAVQTDRNAVLDTMQEVYQDWTLFGDEVGDHGWIWSITRATVATVAGVATVSLSGLSGGIPISIRRPDGGTYPISLAPWQANAYEQMTYDRSFGATPESWHVASYEPATDNWTVRLWPVPTGAETLSILYQRQGDELVDSYANADSVFIPTHLRPGLIKGVVAQGFLGSDRLNRYQIAKQEYQEWKEKARLHVLRRQRPRGIVVDSELQIRTGRVNPEMWAWA